MTLLPIAIAITLCLYVAAVGRALLRLLRGPRSEDRLIALDFIYLVAMLAMLVLAVRYGSEMYFEAALLMALFGFLSSSAIAKFLLRGEVIE